MKRHLTQRQCIDILKRLASRDDAVHAQAHNEVADVWMELLDECNADWARRHPNDDTSVPEKP